jgi:PEP-CTERM motif
MSPISVGSADTKFFGTTGTGSGHGWAGDGSGFFIDGTPLLPSSGQIVTIQVRAWFNGGGLYSSYGQALAAGHNVGESNPIGLTLGIPPGPAANMDGLLPFTVGIPEPTAFALLGLGALGLFLLRRRTGSRDV